MGPAGLFCVRLSQFLMSGSRGHPDDQYRNEKRTRCNTDGPARSRTISSWRYPIRAGQSGAGKAGGARAARGGVGRSSGESGDCRGRAAPGLQRPGTQPDYVVFY